MKFSKLGLDDKIIEAIEYMGFEEATPIQEEAIPAIINKRDLIACAQTGTGKTAAFILPVLHSIYQKGANGGTKALVVCPTRELAIQIELAIQGFAYFLGIHSIAIYGGGDGDDWEQQKKALSRGADIIVATPGKLISHLNMGYVKFKEVDYFILDEADRMMDMGFRDDIKKIASFLPKDRQTLMFSATMPQKIRQLSKELLKNPHEISLALSKPAEGVLQGAYLVRNEHKIPLLAELIADKPNYESILIFSSTKKNVADITRALKRKDFAVEAISSDLDQDKREEVLKAFSAKRLRILVATDVLSRGIDIKEINLVINFDIPKNAEDYVHRIGRTARADTTGVALTFVNADDMYSFSKIEKLMEMEVMKIQVPPHIGESLEWSPKSSGRWKGSRKKNTGYRNKGRGRKKDNRSNSGKKS